MHWTTAENLAEIRSAMKLAKSMGAEICAFSELAVTGFHRQIVREADPEIVSPAMSEVMALAAELRLAIAVGAPTFADQGQKFISHYMVDESGTTVACVSKRGLTDTEATFFSKGSTRPVGVMYGLKCSAVICREVGDLDLISKDLPSGSVDLVFVPGALRQDPEKPRTDPPEYVLNIQRLSKATGAYVVHTNWPNALNRPEESSEGGGSTVAGRDGEVLFRLPMRESGVGVFNLGEATFDWHRTQ